MTTDFTELHEWLGLDENGEPPELHEDLVPYVDDAGMFPVLKHPLVFQVPYSPHLAGLANKQYEAKLQQLKRAHKEKQWDTVIFLHERPYRVAAFEDLCWQLSNREYWSLLADIWVDTENLWQEEELWRDLLTCDRRERRRHFMTEDEREFLRVLGGDSDTITIYRGTSAPDGMGAGLSWTLNRPRAEWFARRYTHDDNEPKLLVGKVKRRDIIAYLDRRSEWEIVALPEDVEIVEVLDAS